MTEKEKLELAIKKGYTYDPDTGNVYGLKNNLITNKNDGYIVFNLCVDKRSYTIKAYRFGWYYIHKECAIHIDHINGKRDDNKISNLRSVTNQQNHQNRLKAKGYYHHKPTNTFMAYICIDKKLKCLGYFKTEEEAKEVYQKSKKKYFNKN